MRYLPLLLAVLFLAGCAPTLKMEQHSRPVREIADSDFPRTVAILPFVNQTGEPQIDLTVRRAFANHFSATPYRDMKLPLVDEKLARFRQASGKETGSATPQELAQALGCDGLVYGRVTGFQWLYAGVYSQLGIEAEVWMVNSRTGGEIFRLKKAVRYHEGGIPTTPLSAVVTVVSTALNLREIQRVRMVNELAYSLMLEVPAPSVQAEESSPVIREVLTNAADGPFGKRRLIRVGLQGEPGMVASFDLGSFRRGIPMREGEPGIYAGEYAVLPGDTVRDMPVSVTLARPGGRETVWGDVGEYITIDTEAPPPVQNLRAKGYADRIELTWEGVKNTPDLKGYRVLRSRSPLSGYTELAQTESTTYTDTTAAPGIGHYYRVIPVDRVGNEPEAADQAGASLRALEPRPLADLLKVDTTLDGDYLVTATLTVPRGVTLKVADGTRLLFAPGTGLIVRGTLLSRGAETPVEYLPSTDEGWEGIRLEGGKVDMTGFRLRDAVTGITASGAEGLLENGTMIDCDTGLALTGTTPLAVRAVTLSGAVVGVRLSGSAARLHGNTIVQNDVGVMMEGFSGELRDNTIRDNERNVVSDQPVSIGPNWFGTIRREELGVTPNVTVDLVYDAPLPGGRPVPPVTDPYLRLSAEERQQKSTELVIEAGAWFRQANYGKAAMLFDEARKVAPTAEIYYYLGICHEQMKEPERARTLLREGTARFPRDPLLWKALGVLLTEEERVDEARAALDEALRLSPGDRQARFLRDRLGEKGEGR